MTKEEFFEKYGHVVVKFSSYYKYVFTFAGTLEDGSQILVDYGGDSGEIYRYSLSKDDEITVEDLWPSSGRIIKDGKEVEEFYDY